MNKELKALVLVAGALGLSYVIYNKMNSPVILDLGMTRKILQEIKHQMLIVTINFAEGIAKHAGSKPVSDDPAGKKIKQYFVTQLGKVYEQKQELILAKYTVTKQCYERSLKRYQRDHQISANQNQIIEMMTKAIDGKIPDLSTNETAEASFSKHDIKGIYTDMCKLVSRRVTEKLQQQKRQNPYFDPSDDSSFRKVIRKLSIYDLKVDFLRQKGFLDTWGCPNQVFFKISEKAKHLDLQFKASMVKVEKAYQRVIDIVSKDPNAITVEEIDKYFEDKKPQEVIISKSVNVDPVNPKEEIDPAKLSKSFSAEPQKKVQEKVEVNKDEIFDQQILEEKPIAVQPIVEQPIAKEPVAEAPVAVQPIIKEPVIVQQPAVDEKQVAVEDPVAQPAVEQPAVEQPAVEQPAVEQPAVEQPIIAEPAAEQPVAEQPIAEQPVAEQPVADEPVVEGAKDVEQQVDAEDVKKKEGDEEVKEDEVADQ